MRASLDLHHLGLASTTTNNGWNKIKIYISLIWKKTGCRQFWRSNSPEIRTYSPFNFALHLSIVDSWPKMDAEISATMSTLYTGKWEEIKGLSSAVSCSLEETSINFLPTISAYISPARTYIAGRLGNVTPYQTGALFLRKKKNMGVGRQWAVSAMVYCRCTTKSTPLNV